MSPVKTSQESLTKTCMTSLNISHLILFSKKTLCWAQITTLMAYQTHCTQISTLENQRCLFHSIFFWSCSFCRLAINQETNDTSQKQLSWIIIVCIYMLWFNFILGSNFYILCFGYGNLMIMSLKQKKKNLNQG